MQLSFSSAPEIVDQIIKLQRQNLRKFLTQEERATQGFLYVEHEPDNLKQICLDQPAVVARDGEHLAGYAICMNKTQGGRVPELIPFFSKIDLQNYEDIPLSQINYLVCGQVCVDKPYRGQNLVGQLYNHMSLLRPKYKFCITEISMHNKRSLGAHYKIGFEPILEYLNASGERWQIVAWNWNSQDQGLNL
ncbi:MAG: hypothetical protein SH818_07470 [Saprospiraceae bacterium]|nr:hypothetical protein [Saprospiraceae bacterium]